MYQPPTSLPTDPQALVLALVDELRRVSQGIQAPGSITLSPQRTAPAKPRDGDIVFVDGTAWIPPGGNGPGFYGYRSSAWRFLG